MTYMLDEYFMERLRGASEIATQPDSATILGV